MLIEPLRLCREQDLVKQIARGHIDMVVAMTAFREKFVDIAIAVLPFLALILAVLMLVTFVPSTALFLVRQ